MGLVAPRNVGSSQIRARTRVPCIGRQILNHCATREAPSVFKTNLLQLSICILIFSLFSFPFRNNLLQDKITFFSLNKIHFHSSYPLLLKMHVLLSFLMTYITIFYPLKTLISSENQGASNYVLFVIPAFPDWQTYELIV